LFWNRSADSFLPWRLHMRTRVWQGRGGQRGEDESSAALRDSVEWKSCCTYDWRWVEVVLVVTTHPGKYRTIA
jgi:hypothetical protein